MQSALEHYMVKMLYQLISLKWYINIIVYSAKWPIISIIIKFIIIKLIKFYFIVYF